LAYFFSGWDYGFHPIAKPNKQHPNQVWCASKNEKNIDLAWKTLKI
jgi:hypothetical protein